MKHPLTKILVLITVLLFACPNYAFAAKTRIIIDPILTDIKPETLRDTYKCVKVNPPTLLDSGELEFTYTDGHYQRFVRSGNTGKKEIEIGKVKKEIYDWYPDTFSCPRKNINEIQATAQVGGQTFQTIASDIISPIINKFFDVIEGIFNLLFGWITSELFLLIIQQGSFVQNDIVQQGWPFIQGIANLGFIIALLYIALATTLRIQTVTTSVQRLLPKLLAGALLVNFSLVVGGLLIDGSRLVMAIELKLAGAGKGDSFNLIDKILVNSQAYETAGLIMKNSSSTGAGIFNLILKRTQLLITNAALTLGLAIIAFNLFIRYIVILILLVFSPLAYLALTFPKTEQYFHLWWSMFIKWVAYGPIVLFFLLIIAKVSSIGISKDAGTFAYVAQFCVVVALLFIGNSFSKKAAGVGSDIAMSFAAKNPKTAAFLAAGPAGFLAAMGAQSAVRNVRDFGKDAGSGIAARARKGDLGMYGIPKLLAGVERDKDGNRTKDAEHSIGSGLAAKVTGYSPESDKIVREEKEIQNALGSKYNPSFQLTELSNANIVARLDKSTIDAISNKPNNKNEITALVAAISKDKSGKISTETTKLVVNAAIKSNDIGTLRGLASNAKVVSKMGDQQINDLFSKHDDKITENLTKSLATESK